MANPLMQLMGMMGNMGNIPNGGNNPMMMLAQLIKSGGNPQAFLQSVAQNNPQVKEAMDLLNGKTPQDMENICRNLCKQRGINFDAAYAQVQNMLR